jgi:DNA-binding MarR family transcriptional regulator
VEEKSNAVRIEPEGQKVTSGKQQVLVQEEEEEEFSTEDLHGNDSRILALLNEAGSNYSFKGMQRKLGIHQQSLSRALRRLEEMGFVSKSDVGYRLSQTGAAAVARIGSVHVEAKGREYIQLLQTYIPVDVKASEVVRSLVGRWFKNLRWAGLIESGTGFTLQWSSDDGSFQINLRMISDYVVVETNANTEREKLQAMVGSYSIYEQITKILQDRMMTAAPANAYVFPQPAVNN